VPTGFTDSAVRSGLTLPTAIAFGPGGKVFVGEKGGIVKVFDSPSDPTPTQVVDLRARVQDFWDRGLLGLAVDPGFGTAGRNFVYVLYTHDLNPVGNPATWGDGCPTPPGPTTDGCTVTGNLSRIPVDPTTGAASGPEQPLITDGWCQQYPSHSIGHLAFGPDGNLYVTGGDGASFTNTDWGQFGGGAGSPTPANPYGDPPGSVGTPLSPPGAEGGALRSQSPRRVAGHPILLDGAVLRVDPATGSGAAGNPMFDPQNASSNASRIIGYGLRNQVDITFDDQGSVASAGLLLPTTLAERLGIEQVTDQVVDLGDRLGAAHPGRKLLTLVHAMVAGGDCIDDVELLRSGATGDVLGHQVMAASTVGTFLR
jgi:glucose/arabinose dehydrogenase